MIANIVGWGKLSVFLVKTLTAEAITTASIVRVLLAIASAIGLGWALTMTVVNSVYYCSILTALLKHTIYIELMIVHTHIQV